MSNVGQETTKATGCVPVFFTVDDSYAPWLGAALASLVAAASPERTYDVNILNGDLTHEHKQRLEAIVASKPHINLRFVDMKQKIKGIENMACNLLRADYFALSIFYRLFIPDMFPAYDKAVYIDSDVVVEVDIAELFDIDLGDNLIGACRDVSILEIPELQEFARGAMGFPLSEYINSGVLLLNMHGLRERHLAARFLEILGRYHLRTVAPDQDYLNALCHGKICYLPGEWDVMPVEGQAEVPNPKLVHYNLFMKPWCYDDIPYGDRFWRHVEAAGFLEEARAFKAAYPEDQKTRDAQNMQQLLANAASIAHDEVNFRTVFAPGGEKRL